MGKSIVITKNTTLGQLLEDAPASSIPFIKEILERYGLQMVGYGITHHEPLHICAKSQGVTSQTLQRLLRELHTFIVKR